MLVIPRGQIKCPIVVVLLFTKQKDCTAAKKRNCSQGLEFSLGLYLGPLAQSISNEIRVNY